MCTSRVGHNFVIEIEWLLLFQMSWCICTLHSRVGEIDSKCLCYVLPSIHFYCLYLVQLCLPKWARVVTDLLQTSKLRMQGPKPTSKKDIFWVKLCSHCDKGSVFWQKKFTELKICFMCSSCLLLLFANFLHLFWINLALEPIL